MSTTTKTTQKRQSLLSRRRVCVHCGAKLPPEITGFYCQKHGGQSTTPTLPGLAEA